MIEAGLYIAAGFLGAVLIAMMVAPAIWRRAVYLTRRRIEEQVPLTVSELQADKDRLRAEHAVAERKLEVALRKQRELTTRQAGQISDLTETLKARDATIAGRDESIAELNDRLAALSEDLGHAEAELSATKLDRDTTRVTLSARSAELESTAHVKGEVERQLSEARAKLEDQARQIGSLEDRVGELREKLRVQQALVLSARAEARQASELLKTERARASELDQRHERTIQQASDLEEKLARREKEIARLRDARAGAEADLQELEQRAVDAEAERTALEAELGEMTVRFGRLSKLLGERDPEAVIAGFEAQIARLETDLANERSRADALRSARADEGSPRNDDDDALREQIATLAAEIVNMAALLEGEASPIPALIAEAETDEAEGPPSLAARIQALQRRAADLSGSGSAPQREKPVRTSEADRDGAEARQRAESVSG